MVVPMCSAADCQGTWRESRTGVLWTVIETEADQCAVLRNASLCDGQFDIYDNGDGSEVRRKDGWTLDVEASDRTTLVWRMSGKETRKWVSVKALLEVDESVEIREREDDDAVVSLALNNQEARDLRPVIGMLPVFGYVLLVMYAAFWSVVIVMPFTLDQEMTCENGIPRSANILFGGICFAMTMVEIMAASLTQRGQRLLRRKGKTVFLLCLSFAGRFDPYGDITFVSVARKCESDIWKYALGVFVFGVFCLQTVPGFYYVLRFVLYQEDAFKALTYSDFYILVETVDPHDIVVEVPVQMTEAALPPQASALTPLRDGHSPNIKVAHDAKVERTSNTSPLLTTSNNGQYSKIQQCNNEDINEMDGDEYDQDENERAEFEKRQEKLAAADKELKEALNSRDTTSLLIAIEHASDCGYKGQHLSKALEMLDAETKMAHLIGDVKRVLGTIRFLFEDCGQGGLQAFYLYENWSDMKWHLRIFTCGSICAGLFVSLSNPVRAWLSKRSAEKQLQKRIQSQVQVAINAGDAAELKQCCAYVQGMIPQNSMLAQHMRDALLEVPEGEAAKNELKVAEAIARVGQILSGNGRRLTLNCLKRKWAAAQGFYHLIDAYPAGLLALVRLEDDRVVGEVIIHSGSSEIDFRDERLQLFAVTLHESPDDDSDATESVQFLGTEVEDIILFQGDAPDVAMELPEGRHYFDRQQVFGGYLDPAKYPKFLSIQLGDVAKEHLTQHASAEDLQNLWTIFAAESDDPGDPNLTPDGVLNMLASLVLSKQDCCLSLGMIRGPNANRSHDPSVPHIKPGLYAGDYGADNYGKFRRETCLVEYHEFDLTDDIAQFTRFFRGDLPKPFDSLEPSSLEGGKVTVVSGTKITGDVHVPMGAVTWAALVQPSYATLSIEGLGVPPATVRDKTGQEWAVQRAWPGVGTLSCAGFVSPIWDFGWLVIVGEGRKSRFAFYWGRWASDGNAGDAGEAIIVSWVKAQDKARYFQTGKSAISIAF